MPIPGWLAAILGALTRDAGGATVSVPLGSGYSAPPPDLPLYTLTRLETADWGTRGRLEGPGLSVATIELPWRNNLPDVSCILAGDYTATDRWSQKHGRNLYHLEPVLGHTNIELHRANWGGDRSKGLKCDLLGCVGLGLVAATIEGQPGVAQSTAALAALYAATGGRPFRLRIEWADPAMAWPGAA